MASGRITKSYQVSNTLNIDELASFDSVFYLGNPTSNTAQFLALGNLKAVVSKTGNGFNDLQKFRDEINDWCFGWLNYDLKNELEDLHSNNPRHFGNPELLFIQPEYVFEIKDNSVVCHYFEKHCAEQSIEHLVERLWSSNSITTEKDKLHFEPSLSKDEYIKRVEKVKAHIQRGDIYEANFCQLFTAAGSINPFSTYKRLIANSPTPFSAFCKFDEFYTLCASPERFVKKEGTKITTEPIKGTIKRSSKQEEDRKLIERLKNSEKDRTENVMIVDLARNDLSKIASKGSVTVEELFGVYTFPEVHQMISRISCTALPRVSSVEILKALFPIASMTGVPKISALKIIETQEDFKRELYSGCIGYFTPNDDFDFNVVIRSLFYNSALQSASYAVGGAIVNESDPEEEYEETLLKALSIQSLFS